jgi:hypothetical protein
MTKPLMKVRRGSFAFFLLAAGLSFYVFLLLATNALAQSSLQNPPGILSATTEHGAI